MSSLSLSLLHCLHDAGALELRPLSLSSSVAGRSAAGLSHFACLILQSYETGEEKRERGENY